jgi:peptidoglycan/xylan/chitin deacetylase (PgdA/CDA1 family)
MRIPGRKVARTAARWLRSRVPPRSLILGYHRIAADPWDPLDLAVSPENFAGHLEAIRDRAETCRLRDLGKGLREGRLPHRKLALTLDDGYEDGLSQVRPLLERFGMRATVFVATGAREEGFWWDELATLLAPPGPLPPRLVLSLAGVTRELSCEGCDDPRARARLTSTIAGLIMRLGPGERRRALDGLWESVGTRSEPTGPHRRLSDGEIVRLAEGGVVEIGSHTVSHPFLGELSPEEQAVELVESKKELEGLLGEPVISLAYPNGSWSADTRRLAREAGYLQACTSEPDMVGPHADPLSLPRFWVPNQDGPSFSRWLSRWLGG